MNDALDTVDDLLDLQDEYERIDNDFWELKKQYIQFRHRIFVCFHAQVVPSPLNTELILASTNAKPIPKTIHKEFLAIIAKSHRIEKEMKDAGVYSEYFHS